MIEQQKSLDGQGLSDTLESICERFESAWLDGTPEPIENHIRGWKGKDRSTLFFELIKMELEYRRKRGELPLPSEYEERFPDQTEAIASAITNARRFFTIRRHAVGGMSEIFEARDDELNRIVAVKRLQSNLAFDDAIRSRFVQEAKIIGGLEHPNIVPIYGLGLDEDGQLFYAMRFMHGESLDKHIESVRDSQRDRDGQIKALRPLLRRFLDVCRAIEYAHSRSVIHRDLKPANVMLGEYGETMVVDWGISKRLSDKEAPDAQMETVSAEQTRAGTKLGTPYFMSPEQASGRMEFVDHRSDIYGLGAILYTILTGRPPYSDCKEDLEEAQKGPPKAPRTVDPSLPAGLEAICLCAMARQPSDRYQNAGELASDIEALLAGEELSIYPDPIHVRMRKFAFRHQLLFSAVAAALLVGLVGVLILYDQARRNSSTINAAFQRERQYNATITRQKSEIVDEKRESVRRLATNYWNIGINQRDSFLDFVKSSHYMALAEQTFEPDTDTRNAGFIARSLSRNVALEEIIEHDDEIRGAIFVRESNDVLSWSLDGMIGKRNAQQEEVTQLNVGAKVLAASMLGGSRIAVQTANHTVEIWDYQNEVVVCRIQHPAPINGFRVNEENARCLSWDQSGLVLLSSIPLGEEIARVKIDTPVRHAVMSTDAEKIACWSHTNVAVLRNLEAGERFELPHAGKRVMGARFNNEGSQLLSWSEEREVIIWNTSDGEKLHATNKHRAPVAHAMFDRNEKRVLSRSNFSVVAVTARGTGDVQLWDPERDELVTVPHDGGVVDARFNQRQSAVLSWGWQGGVKYWNAAVGRVVATTRHSSSVLGAQLIEDEQRVISWARDGARIWSVSNGDIHARCEHIGLNGLKYAAGSGLMVTSSLDGSLRLWDTKTGTLLAGMQHGSAVMGMAFSPDEKKILSWSTDLTVRVWDIQIQEPWSLVEHREPVRLMLFDREGKGFLKLDDELQWVDLEDVSQVIEFELPSARLFGVIYSATKKWVLGGSSPQNKERFARLWDARTGAVLRDVDGLGGASILQFSQDDSELLAVFPDGSITLWSTDDWKEKWRRKLDPPRKAKIVNDQGLVLTWSGQPFVYQPSSVQLWDTRRDELKAELKHPGNVVGAAYLPGGNRILSWDHTSYNVLAESLTLWNVDTQEIITEFPHDRLTGAVRVAMKVVCLRGVAGVMKRGCGTWSPADSFVSSNTLTYLEPRGTMPKTAF